MEKTGEAYASKTQANYLILARTDTKKPQLRTICGFSTTTVFTAKDSSTKLTLGELRSATCFVQADFLTFNFTRIAGQETGSFERTAQGFVVLQQGTRNA